ncbi:TIGR03086 family metal-binding protein [Amycolatopsis sp. OK19-0408]|uniref:TIGR03086 family metal-binding protein n=1 Tax=Amycolatopsis iheyensis TaxID=2945988 RepID=A0A9X2SIU0_9PSEU|nr:TIGR03086 family metal-binding protein [Amycolatopsis iheyensis]MCR6482141.1 TIGR03086 family metal-binding protein [Amycolatopsis iheyensis]
MDLLEAHGQALRAFGDAVHAAGAAEWGHRTPCPEWTVRDLVNHLVAEQLWAPSLLAGATLDDVGDRFDGDVLGPDPVSAWDAAAEAAREAFLDDGVLERAVHLSFGLVPAREYAWQMTIDAAVHAWDLATALGLPCPVTSDLAERLLDVVRPWVDEWQGLGIFDPPVAVSRDAGATARLVALLGRQPR